MPPPPYPKVNMDMVDMVEMVDMDSVALSPLPYQINSEYAQITNIGPIYTCYQ